MFSAINQMGIDYYNALPNHIGSRVMASGYLSLGVNLYLHTKREVDAISVDILAAGEAAAVAATASLVHALLTPLFKKAFGRNHGDWAAESIKMMVVTLIVTGLSHKLVIGNPKTVFYTAFSMNLIASILNSAFRSEDNSAYIYFNI